MVFIEVPGGSLRCGLSARAVGSRSAFYEATSQTVRASDSGSPMEPLASFVTFEYLWREVRVSCSRYAYV